MLRSVQLLAEGMSYGRAAGTVCFGWPETSIVPPPTLAAPLFLPPTQAFFHFLPPPLLQASFLSLLPSSFLLSLCLIILEG